MQHFDHLLLDLGRAAHIEPESYGHAVFVVRINPTSDESGKRTFDQRIFYVVGLVLPTQGEKCFHVLGQC